MLMKRRFPQIEKLHAILKQNPQNILVGQEKFSDVGKRVEET